MGMKAQMLWEQVEEWEEELVALRRLFHQYPESGWEEFYTTGMIANYLTRHGIVFHYGKEIVNRQWMCGREEEEIRKAVAYAKELGVEETVLQEMDQITGLEAVIETGRTGPVCVLRFDIDGLKEEEANDREYRPVKEHFCSIHKGYMHACGHDGHIAMGLVLTRFLFEHREQFCGQIRVVFQPAEEGVRGGKSFATGGVLDGADYFLSGHLGMGNKTGELVLGTYGFLATTKVDVEFIGVSAHAGAAPETGKNALLCACHAVVALQTLCQDSRGVSRINVGVIKAGNNRNVIADYGLIQLETRGETTEIEQELYKKAMDCIKGAASMYGCDYKIIIKGSAKEAKSDKGLIKKAKEALLDSGLYLEKQHEKQHKIDKKSLNSSKESIQAKGRKTIQTLYEEKEFKGSEDVTYFMKEIQEHGGQALYLGIGANINAPHHNTKFDFDERALTLGTEVYIAILQKLMGKSENKKSIEK